MLLVTGKRACYRKVKGVGGIREITKMSSGTRNSIIPDGNRSSIARIR